MGEKREHAGYPHHPGMLYDCDACREECFCDETQGGLPCVHCTEDRGWI